MRREIALAAAVVCAIALVLLRPGTALGHAALVRAEPGENAFLRTSPVEVALTFSETIDGQSSGIRVLDARGQPVASGPAQRSANGLTLRTTLPALKPGIYNVLWNNISAIDGHPLQGSYPFTVLNADGSLPQEVNQVSGPGSDPDPPPQADATAVRALSLLGLLLAAGGALLSLFLPSLSGGVRRGLVGTVLLGVATAGLGALLDLQLIHETFPGRGLWSLVVETRTGSFWLMRLGGVFFLGVAAWMLPESPKAAAAAALAGVAVCLAAYTATSHAAAGAGDAWAMAFDMLHGAAAIGWLGALAGLLVCARLLGCDGPYRALMPRFSLFASAMVFLLFATGLLNSFVELDSFDRLWSTRYGLTLLVKLGFTLPLLAVAFYNAKAGRARLERLAPGEPRRFIATVLAEALLAGLVLVSAAVLTQTTTAKSVFDRPPDRPFDRPATVSGLDVRLQIDPNRTGLNTYTITLSGGGGEPVDAQRVRLTFRYQDDQAIGASNLTLAAGSAPGTFSGAGPFLTLEGRWQVEVEVRRADVDDVKAFFDVRPAGSAIGVIRTGGAFDNPAPGVTWNTLGGVVALLAGLGFTLFKWGVPLRRRGISLPLNAAVIVSFGLGTLLLFGVHSHQATSGFPSNPIFPDANSIAIGRSIFENNCTACHGRNGVPPSGLNLNPYPLDLTIHVPQHPDGALFQYIARGFPGTAMRPWAEGQGKLSDEQIWHTVNFLRTLGGVDR